MFGKQGKPASIIPEISIVKWKEHIYDICISNKQNENLYKKKQVSVAWKCLGFRIIKQSFHNESMPVLQQSE